MTSVKFKHKVRCKNDNVEFFIYTSSCTFENPNYILIETTAIHSNRQLTTEEKIERDKIMIDLLIDEFYTSRCNKDEIDLR